MGIPELSDEFFARAVAVKYRAVEGSLRHVRASVIYHRTAYPHILEEAIFEEPEDYFTVGAALACRIDEFLDRYNHIMTPAESEQAGEALDQIIQDLDVHIKMMETQAVDFELRLEDTAFDTQIKLFSDLPLARIRDFLLDWSARRMEEPIRTVKATVAPAPEAAVRRAVNDAMNRRWGRKPSFSPEI